MGDKTISTHFIPLSPDHVREWIMAVTKPAEFLLIDDDVNDRIIFERFSKGWHCKFDTADGLDEAKMRVATKRYKLIFLDLKFRGYNGLDIFKELKRLNDDVRVAVVSGHIDNSIIHDFQQIGFAIFIAKPQAFTNEFFSSLYSVLNITKLPIDDRLSK